MGRTTKTIIDIVIGAVIPILILNNLTNTLGAVPTYLLAALIPVAWVFIDLFFITRRFNVITSYAGAAAILRGLLAFWFVDGWQFALKDTSGTFVAILIFAWSLLAGRPLVELFWRQSLSPDTPEREERLKRLVAEPQVHRALMAGTAWVLVINIIVALANVLLNLYIVVAPFGSEAFNQQVARVNAITRIALTIPELLAFIIAFWLLFRAVGMVVGDLTATGGDDFWEMLDRWDGRPQSA